MKRRHLRIAFSAVCGVLCLLLIALWVRSPNTGDVLRLRVTTTKGIGFTSNREYFAISLFDLKESLKRHSLGHTSYKPTAFPAVDSRWGAGVDKGRLRSRM
jgi:hypothetical protein